MIAKIIKGKGFRGLVEYLHQTPDGEERGQLLATNLAGSTPREWAKEFGLVRQLRPTLGKAVFHASLSPSPDDPPLTDEEYGRIARYFMNGMGFPEDAPYVVIRHDDQTHPHIHIAASRITPSGDVVSDARDFQRAEAIVREIETSHGLRAVEPSATTKKKRPSRRSKTMEEQGEEQANRQQKDEINGLEVSGLLDEEQRQAARRRLLDDEYREQLRERFKDEIAFIRRNRKRPSLNFRFKDGSSLHDHGDRLQTDCKDEQTAARRLVIAAVAKGWTTVTFRGNAVFVKEAMREAMKNGLQIATTDAAQAALLDEVMQERSGIAGAGNPQPAAQAAPAPSPTPKPPPPIDMGKLATMRQQRTGGQKSGPKMRRK